MQDISCNGTYFTKSVHKRNSLKVYRQRSFRPVIINVLISVTNYVILTTRLSRLPLLRKNDLLNACQVVMIITMAAGLDNIDRALAPFAFLKHQSVSKKKIAKHEPMNVDNYFQSFVVAKMAVYLLSKDQVVS